MFCKLVLIFISSIFFNLNAEEVHQFTGKHFFASYIGCDHKALSNAENLKESMTNAVKASGANLLNSVDYVFPPDGFSMVLLLSESHASIHTYPEYNTCFIDLFTCGDNCSAESFNAVLAEYLKPEYIEQKLILRGYEVEVLD